MYSFLLKGKHVFEWIGLFLSMSMIAFYLVKPWGYWLYWGFILIGLGVLYGYFGHMHTLMMLHQKQVKLKQAQALLSTYKDPDAIVIALKRKLRFTPEHARGWYLLGRLYMTQQKYLYASQAFKKANTLKPHHALYQIAYAMSLWMQQHHQLSPPLKKRFLSLVNQYPHQLEPYMVLALDAEKMFHVKDAVIYWRQLLSLLDPHSNEAAWVRKKIITLQSKNRHVAPSSFLLKNT